MPDDMQALEWYTAAEAQLAGNVPPGMVWDEEAQRPIPRGAVPMVRPNAAESHLTAEQMKAQKATVLRYVHDQLEEAVYRVGREGERIGIEKVNDFYRLPGSEKPALSKRGAEALQQFFRLKVRRSEIVGSEHTKEYVFARAQCEIHRGGEIIASESGAASTAEQGYQRAAKKYRVRQLNGKDVLDWRAAINDVEAKAQKRAMVRATIKALGATDILEIADEAVVDEEAQHADPRTVVATKLLERLQHPTFSDEERTKAEAWLAKPTRTLDQVQSQLDAAEDRIVRWEEQQEDEEPPL